MNDINMNMTLEGKRGSPPLVYESMDLGVKLMPLIIAAYLYAFSMPYKQLTASLRSTCVLHGKQTDLKGTLSLGEEVVN